MADKILHFAATALLVTALLPLAAYADENADAAVYYIGNAVNAGLDTGYSESSEIRQDDVHFGWSIGQFYVSGYTSMTEDAKGNPVFLKTAGDQIRLSFRLDQDIDALNGNRTLSVNTDNNGSDTHFGIPKTDFGRGTLIVRQTNHQNATLEPQIYTDYLVGITQGADTEVQLFEEGDYEISLNYELKDDPRKIGPVSIAPGFSNYKIAFEFSVRNGNCMVFPFDVATHSELANESHAPSGFYLDLAQSRYLDIYVKKEVMAAGDNGLVEDIRFNGPARDGDEYTEEGVYTITASNEQTGQTTVKVIYVGDDPVLKAHAATGLSVSEINQRVSAGETITEDGRLVPAAYETRASQFEEAGEQSASIFGDLVIPIAIAAGCAVAAAIAFTVARRRKTPQTTTPIKLDDPETREMRGGEDR